MFDILVAVLNTTPDAVRFAVMDAAPALFDLIASIAAEQGCTFYEDGTITCK